MRIKARQTGGNAVQPKGIGSCKQHPGKKGLAVTRAVSLHNDQAVPNDQVDRYLFVQGRNIRWKVVMNLPLVHAANTADEVLHGKADNGLRMGLEFGKADHEIRLEQDLRDGHRICEQIHPDRGGLIKIHQSDARMATERAYPQSREHIDLFSISPDVGTVSNNNMLISALFEAIHNTLQNPQIGCVSQQRMKIVVAVWFQQDMCITILRQQVLEFMEDNFHEMRHRLPEIHRAGLERLLIL